MPKLKGQDATIKLIIDGSVEVEADSFVSLEITTDGELIEDDYLGEVTKDYDHVFNGYKVNMTGHMRRKTWFEFDKKLSLAQKYQAGGLSQVDMMVILRFPETGEFTQMTFNNLKAGPRQVNFGGRTDRAEFSVELACKTRTDDL